MRETRPAEAGPFLPSTLDLPRPRKSFAFKQSVGFRAVSARPLASVEDEPAKARQGVEVSHEERGEGLALLASPPRVLQPVEVEAPALALLGGHVRHLCQTREGNSHLHPPPLPPVGGIVQR